MTSDDDTTRPYDPAGTRPKHRPEDLLPPAAGDPQIVDGHAEEEPLRGLGTGEGEAGGDRTLLPEAQTGGAVGPVAPPAAKALQAGRFRMVFAALFLVAVLGVGAAVMVAVGSGDDDTPKGPAWSAWQPTGSATERVNSIATRVGKEYRGVDGQLVAVTGGPLEVAGLPLTVAVKQTAAQGGDIELQQGTGVLYRLCGLGTQCSILTGKPSAERLLLLRRESLELALYTFTYTKEDKVVVFLPPAKGASPTQAQYFTRGNLKSQLAQPLTQSLQPEAPTVAAMPASPDARLVEGLTAPSLFKFSLTQANTDSSAFLVLSPLLSTT